MQNYPCYALLLATHKHCKQAKRYQLPYRQSIPDKQISLPLGRKRQVRLQARGKVNHLHVKIYDYILLGKEQRIPEIFKAKLVVNGLFLQDVTDLYLYLSTFSIFGKYARSNPIISNAFVDSEQNISKIYYLVCQKRKVLYRNMHVLQKRGSKAFLGMELLFSEQKNRGNNLYTYRKKSKVGNLLQWEKDIHSFLKLKVLRACNECLRAKYKHHL